MTFERAASPLSVGCQALPGRSVTTATRTLVGARLGRVQAAEGVQKGQGRLRVYATACRRQRKRVAAAGKISGVLLQTAAWRDVWRILRRFARVASARRLPGERGRRDKLRRHTTEVITSWLLRPERRQEQRQERRRQRPEQPEQPEQHQRPERQEQQQERRGLQQPGPVPVPVQLLPFCRKRKGSGRRERQ